MYKNIVIVYMSRTGKTEKLANMLKEKLTESTVKMVKFSEKDKRYQSALGYIKSVWDSACEIEIEKEGEEDVGFASADLIILGCPIWNWALPNPAKQFIIEQKEVLKTKPIALIHSMGNNGEDRVSAEVTKLIDGHAPFAQLSVSERRHWEKKEGKLVQEMLDEFVQILKTHSGIGGDEKRGEKRDSRSITPTTPALDDVSGKQEIEIEEEEQDKDKDSKKVRRSASAVTEGEGEDGKPIKVGKGAFLYWEL